MPAFERIVRGILVIVIVVFAGILLVRHGSYGWTLFVVLPIITGAVGSWVFQASTPGNAAATGALATTLASASLLLIGLEGIVCIAMALPLTLPLGALGGFLFYSVRLDCLGRRGIAALFMIPSATLVYDGAAKPPVFEVRSSIEIDAPSAEVWKHVVEFSELAEPQEWYFRAGIAYPKRARIEGAGPGAIRYCDFSTGSFVEPIEVWSEPHLLRFRVTENPAPMREWSPYSQVQAPHLHGYFISRHGQFRLTELGNGRTLLEGITWYQHGLWPAGYWRWWSDAILHRIHMRVLLHIRALSEGQRSHIK